MRAQLVRQIVAPRLPRARLLVVVLLFSLGCQRLAQRHWFAKYDADAAEATRGYERAKSDSERASRLAERGRAYSDKGRYSRFAKCTSLADYERLFAQAMQDHDRAVALAPTQSDVYVLRGWSYYDRATVIRLDSFEDPSTDRGWLTRAEADFTRALERDPRNTTAWDMRALVRGTLGDRDGVIADLTASMKIDPAARARLADAYCERGRFRHQGKDYAGAAADYEQAITLEATPDGCSCDPYAPLVYLYVDGLHDLDKGRRVFERARAAHRWVPPELEAKLGNQPADSP